VNEWSKTGVYLIKNVINGHCYVGSTSSRWGINHRVSNHISDLKKGIHHSQILQRAWNKYGESSFSTEILEECSPEDCLEREQHYLDTLRPYYNIHKVAGSPRGRVVSEETKSKISAALTGRKLSPDHKKKISESLRGKPLTKEHIEKVNASLIGKRKTGRENGRFTGCFVFENTETLEKFIGGKFELAKTYGLDLSGISKICLGKRKSYRKWICLGKDQI
jgi:group I intron endonuclease